MEQRAKVIAVAAGLAAAGLGGCGGGNDNGSGTTARTPAPAAPAGSALTIKMSEFKFDPKNATAKAGTVKITAPNVGTAEHELVLFKTNRAPGSFKVSGARVDEEALDKTPGVTGVGEIADVEPKQTKSASFDLTPGRYVMICNVAGHYKSGMYGTITVR